MSQFQIGNQITLAIGIYSLTAELSQLEGLGATRRQQDPFTARAVGSNPVKGIVIRGPNGLQRIHEFSLNLTLSRSDFQTLWRIYKEQQATKLPITLTDDRQPFFSTGTVSFETFSIWITQPPIEILGGRRNTSVGTDLCPLEVIQSVRISAREFTQ